MYASYGLWIVVLLDYDFLSKPTGGLMLGNLRAWALQEAVRKEEREQLGSIDYSEEQVRQATVHAREDLVLVVSHLNDINKKLGFTKWLLVIVVVLLAVIAGNLAA